MGLFFSTKKTLRLASAATAIATYGSCDKSSRRHLQWRIVVLLPPSPILSPPPMLLLVLLKKERRDATFKRKIELIKKN